MHNFSMGGAKPRMSIMRSLKSTSFQKKKEDDYFLDII